MLDRVIRSCLNIFTCVGIVEFGKGRLEYFRMVLIFRQRSIAFDTVFLPSKVIR